MIKKAFTAAKGPFEYFMKELGWIFRIGWTYHRSVPSGGHGFMYEYRHDETGEIRYSYTVD